MIFGWRKRSEGFEWREYVRTTILVRRADRQKRMDDARMAALSKVKDARDRGVNAGLKQVEAAKGGIVAAGQKAGATLIDTVLAAMQTTFRLLRLAGGKIRRPFESLPALSLPQGARRAASLLALYGADVPRRWRRAKPYLLPTAGAAAAVFVFGSALAPQNATIAALVETSANSDAVERSNEVNSRDGIVTGRASAVTGDTLRVSGKILRLAGIDAPVPGQTCSKSNGKKWPCAAAARSALERLVHRQRISCEQQTASDGGQGLAHCRAGQIDIAQELVRRGHVFASDKIGKPYASEEESAKSEQAGIWQGQVDHPDTWRTKVWDEAKRAAPDGCPIKGLVRSEGRIYAMPWSDGYNGRALRPVKGERWFCSEDEARAAGFRPSTRS